MATGSGTGTPSTAGGTSGYILFSEIRELLDTHLPDISTTLFPTLIRYRQVKAAHEQYCRDWPDLGLAESAGDDGRYYAITSLISDWVEGFSQVRSIEYPAATFSSDESPNMLKRADWRDDVWGIVSTVKTLGAIIFLITPSNKVLSADVFEATVRGDVGDAAALSMVMVLVAALGVLAIYTIIMREATQAWFRKVLTSRPPA